MKPLPGGVFAIYTTLYVDYRIIMPCAEKINGIFYQHTGFIRQAHSKTKLFLKLY